MSEITNEYKFNFLSFAADIAKSQARNGPWNSNDLAKTIEVTYNKMIDLYTKGETNECR